MTLNLNYDGDTHGPWPVRRALIAGAIRRCQPDLVALQAVRRDPMKENGRDQACQLADRLPEFKQAVFWPAAEHGGATQDGSAFLSRGPLEDVTAHRLQLALDPNSKVQDLTPRIVLYGRVTHPPLQVFNGHLSWVPSQGVAHVDEALAVMRRVTGPCVLVGDLNAGPETELTRRLAAAGWTDAWATLHPDEPGYTFESQAPDKRIDYVWVTAELRGSLEAIDLIRASPNDEGARLSDHLGLLVVLRR